MSSTLLAAAPPAKHSAPNNVPLPAAAGPGFVRDLHLGKPDKKAWAAEIHTPTAGEYNGNVPLADIVPDPRNRKDFDAAALQSLADQIKAEGLLQPIVVRPIGKHSGVYASANVPGFSERKEWNVWPAQEVPVKPGRVPLYGPCGQKEAESVATLYRSGQGFQIIAGERRFLACKKLGWLTIPAMIRKSETDLTAARKQAIENEGREDLNPIERARNYARLIELGDKQKDLMELFKLSQPVISNTLRLLELPEAVQQMVSSGKLSHAHGVALARWAKWKKLCERIALEAIQSSWMTAKRLSEETLPFSDELGKAGLITFINVNKDDYQGRPAYVLSNDFQKDPDFIKGSYATWYYVLPTDGKAANKWAPEKAKQDLAREQKEAAAKKKAAASDGKKTPEQKARAKKIADNKAARAAIAQSLGLAEQKLKTGKAGDVALACALVCQKSSARGYGADFTGEAARLGIKLPAKFDGYKAASWSALKNDDALRLVALGILSVRAAEASRFAGEVPEEIEFLTGGKSK